MDSLFRVEVLARTLFAEKLIYQAMHQDYSEEYVWDEFDQKIMPTSEACGELVIKHLLKGDRGHFGCVEHPQITFAVGFFPHSTMQQIRTHRVAISFDVQSFRYTGKRISAVATGERTVEEVFYFRPVGSYTDRQGKKYIYSQEARDYDLKRALDSAKHYDFQIKSLGMAEEHARSSIHFDVRQHFVMSVNVRSLMHLLDLRAKADAQLECQQLCELILPHFRDWTPAIAKWYEENRWGKARLAP